MSFGTIQAEKMTTESGYTLGAGDASSFKNRIINGDMLIDQRNVGASVTSAAGGTFSVDRFSSFAAGGGVYTTQQSTDVPTGQGFKNSIVSTVTTTDSPTGTDYYIIQYGLEGYDMADLLWGSASAKTITMSFWVKSSLTGTYTVALRNSALTRSYRATYTVNSANTWEQKTITVAGDTTGTWLTTNGAGLRIGFTLGAGADYIDTGNVWSALEDFAATGQTQWISTSGATFYVTGFQFEVGTVATSFDFRSYGTELALCQRYYETMGIGTGGTSRGNTFCSATRFAVPKRASPTIAVLNSTLSFSNGSGTATTLTGATLGGAAGISANGVCQDIFGTFSTSPTNGLSLVLLTDNAASVSAEL
jgi:hypothetical protein